MQNNTVFDDIMQGLHEVEEYQKARGNGLVNVFHSGEEF